MERGRLPEPQPHLGPPGSRPPLTCQRMWGGAQVRGSSNGLPGRGKVRIWGCGNRGERPTSPSWEASRMASPTIPPCLVFPEGTEGE